MARFEWTMIILINGTNQLFEHVHTIFFKIAWTKYFQMQRGTLATKNIFFQLTTITLFYSLIPSAGLAEPEGSKQQVWYTTDFECHIALSTDVIIYFTTTPKIPGFFEIIYLGRKVLDTIVKSLLSFSYLNLPIVIISNHLISKMTHRNLPSRRRLPQSHATAGRSRADSGSSRWGYPTQAHCGNFQTAALTFIDLVVCCSTGVFSLATTLEGGGGCGGNCFTERTMEWVLRGVPTASLYIGDVLIGSTSDSLEESISSYYRDVCLQCYELLQIQEWGPVMV